MKKMSRPIWYAAVSLLCLATHNVIMIATDAIGFSLLASTLSSFVIVVIVGYLAHSILTFGETLRWSGLQRYAIAMSLNIPGAFIMTWIWKVGCGFPMLIAAPLASATMVAINFLLSRWAIVRPAKTVE